MGGYSANTQSQASMSGGSHNMGGHGMGVHGMGAGLGRRESKPKTGRSGGEYDSRFDTRYQYASDNMSVSSGSVRTQDHAHGASTNSGGGGGGEVMNQYHDNSLFQGDPYATTGAGMDFNFNQYNQNPHNASGGGGGQLWDMVARLTVSEDKG